MSAVAAGLLTPAAGGWSPAGALVGLAFSAGLLLVWRRTPARRRNGLEDRIGPYVRDLPGVGPSVAVVTAPGPRDAVSLARAAVAHGGAVLDRLFGGSASVQRRLVRSGSVTSSQEYRAEQVAWGLGGAFAGLLLGTVLWVRRDAAPLLTALFPIIGVTGMACRDWWLTRAVQRREQRILAELPTVADLLALALNAGEATGAALERVCRLSQGELSRELATAVAETRAGTPIATALQRVADRTEVTALVRFVDGMVIALERGTPLADVVREQARDVRADSIRAVIESAGRKEIGMLVPVVFLILPVTVVFALFPGFASLSLTW